MGRPTLANFPFALGAVAGVIVLLAGCTSTVNGRGGRRAPSSGVRSQSSAAAPNGLCAGRSTAPAIVSCLRQQLGDFWSGELNQVVNEQVILRPPVAQVPPQCRPGLTLAPAFTCRSNLTLYLNRGLLDLINSAVPHNELWYAFAAVQAHEIGHVVQYVLRQPQIEILSPTAAQTRFIEQQADCLSGVWAQHAARSGSLSATIFRKVAVRLLARISSRAEIQTHGTSAQRAAAIDRGLATGRPQSCRLVTFS